jgi:aspartokinase
MISVSQALEDVLERSPNLKGSLVGGILNVTALARKMQPELVARLQKPVSIASVVMALNRLEKKHKDFKIVDVRDYIGDMTIKSLVTVAKFPNSKQGLNISANIMQEAQDIGAYLSLVKGVRETTIITDPMMRTMIDKQISSIEDTHFIEGLGALMIRLIGKHHRTPGIFQFMVQLLAWRGISIVEMLYIEEDVVLIVDQTEVDKAFEALRRASQSKINY